MYAIGCLIYNVNVFLKELQNVYCHRFQRDQRGHEARELVQEIDEGMVRRSRPIL